MKRDVMKLYTLLALLLLTTLQPAAGGINAEREPEPVRRLREIVELDFHPKNYRRPAAYLSDSYFRGNQAAALIEKHEGRAEGRTLALLMLQKYRGGLSEDYFYAACLAALHLGREALRAPLTEAERSALSAFPWKRGETTDCLAGQAVASLAVDSGRDLPEEEQAHAYASVLNYETRIARGIYLIHRGELPPRFRNFLVGLNAFSLDGTLLLEQRSPAFQYFTFRRMKFGSLQEELEFLWQKIRLYQATNLRNRNELTGEMHNSARAATQRLIEIGEPAGTFILARIGDLAAAAQPGDPRYGTRLYEYMELWAPRATLDRRFLPIARLLKDSGNESLSLATRDLIRRIEANAPYPYLASNIYVYRAVLR